MAGEAAVSGMDILLPHDALVLLIGASGSGKSTFARAHFRPTEILSSDACRALVCDDEANQAATADAFAVLHFIAAKRLERGRLTVVDATNVQPEARRPLLELARLHHRPAIAIVFHLPEEICQENNLRRPNRSVPAAILQQQTADLVRSLPRLEAEGFTRVYILYSPEEISAASVKRIARSGSPPC